jgi:putative NADH-flavin reductase
MNEQKVRELARSILKKLNEKFDNKLVLKQEEQQIEEEDISETEAVEEEVIEEEEVVEEDSQNENLNESFTSKKEQRLFKALMGKWCK